MYVWPCIIYENDERYQLDATILIYYYKYLYMFRASICPSSGVLGCIRCILPHMVFITMCCGWGPEDSVCSLVHCVFTHSVQDYTPAPQDHNHNIQCWTPYAVKYNLYSWRWAYRCPKHVEIFMIINRNCCIKVLTLVKKFFSSPNRPNALWNQKPPYCMGSWLFAGEQRPGPQINHLPPSNAELKMCVCFHDVQTDIYFNLPTCVSIRV